MNVGVVGLSLVLLVSVCPACGGDDDGGGGSGTDAGGGEADGGADLVAVPVTTHVGPDVESIMFVAAQDGDGPWQVLEGDGGHYRFETAGRYGLVYVCPDPYTGDDIYVSVLYATVDEAPAPSIGCFLPVVTGEQPTGILNVSMNDLVAASEADVWAAHDRLSLDFDQTFGNIEDFSVPELTDIIVEARMTGGDVDRLALRRGVGVSPEAQTNVVINMDQGFAPETHTYSVTGAEGGETVTTSIFLSTENGEWVISLDQDAGTYPAMPAARLRDDDFFTATATASEEGGSRRAALYWHDPMDVELTLPEPVSPLVGQVLEATPSLLYELTFDDSPEGSYIVASFATDFFFVTRGWMDGQTRIALPDVTGLDGWTDDWGIQEFPVTGSVSVVETDIDLEDVSGYPAWVWPPVDPASAIEAGHHDNRVSRTIELGP
jgi:hypothetical protein